MSFLSKTVGLERFLVWDKAQLHRGPNQLLVLLVRSRLKCSERLLGCKCLGLHNALGHLSPQKLSLTTKLAVPPGFSSNICLQNNVVIKPPKFSLPEPVDCPPLTCFQMDLFHMPDRGPNQLLVLVVRSRLKCSERLLGCKCLGLWVRVRLRLLEGLWALFQNHLR